MSDKISIEAPSGIPTEMVAAYVERWLAALPDAHAAVARLDHDFLRVYGHRLKGSGGGYGIPRLTEIGALIEEAAKRGDAAELQSQVATLEFYLNRLAIVPSK